MAKNKKNNKYRARVDKGISITKAIADATSKGIQLTTTKLDIRQNLRQPLDLIKWRNATRVAESVYMPRRVLLYDLYTDIMVDGHVIAVIDKRMDAVLTAKWQFVDKDEKPVDEVNQLLDSIGFADLLREILNSIYWGYSMIECNIYKDDTGRWQMTAEQFNRKHMRPEKGMIAYDQNGEEGFSIREGRFAYTVLECGKPRDLGLLISAAQYAILKRNNVSDWANFIEVFGQPIMDAEWDGFDEDQRIKLLAAITAMGNSGKLVRPAGTKVNFLTEKGVQTGQLQHSFADFLNKEISKALLGTTETVESSNTSGYAQAEEHGQQDNKKNSKDLDFVRRVLISNFTRIMKAFGLPVEGGKFIIPDAKNTLAPTDAFNMFVQMDTDLGIPVDHDFIYEFTGMPKPKDYDAQIAAKKAATVQQTQILEESVTANPANTPPAKEPKAVDKPADKSQTPGKAASKKVKLALAFLDFFRIAPEVTGPIKLDLLYQHCECSECQGIQLAAGGDGHRDILDRFLKDVHSGKLKPGNIQPDYYTNLAQTLTKAVNKGLGGTTFGAADYRNGLKAHLDHNIYAFSGAKSLTMLLQYNALLRDENGEILPYNKFKERALVIDEKYNKTYLEAEYDTTVACTQMAESWPGLKNFKLLEFSTTGGENVCPVCGGFDRMIIASDDPILNRVCPPLHFKCKCKLIPAAETDTPTDRDKIKTVEKAANIQPYFKNNPGKTKTVFNANHPYFKNNGGGKTTEWDAVKNYGFKSVEKIYATADLPTLTYMPDKQSALDWWTEQTEGIKTFEVASKDGLTVTFDKTFRDHVLEQNADSRYQILNRIPEILRQPDEIWSRMIDGHPVINYIKYYDNAPLIIQVDTQKNVRGATLYEATKKGKINYDSVSNLRKGQLKYKK